jgi:pSer/pThr/pTyr-binding forkhead associated (FHA) protein
LSILSGRTAGQTCVVRSFPFVIGRSPEADLQLEEEGVWDKHLQLDLNRPDGFVIACQSGALARLNNQPLEGALLRSGDLVQFGSIKMQFWLSPVRQRGLRLREWLTWAAIAAISLGQVALIYRLLK